jgi:hypothetical protein
VSQEASFKDAQDLFHMTRALVVATDSRDNQEAHRTAFVSVDFEW